MVLQKAISEAKSLEEVEKLKATLQAGQMPNRNGHSTEHEQHISGKILSEYMVREIFYFYFRK